MTGHLIFSILQLVMFIKTENANSHMLGTFQRLPESEGQSASALFVVHINMEELCSTLLASRVLTEALLRLNFVFLMFLDQPR